MARYGLVWLGKVWYGKAYYGIVNPKEHKRQRTGRSC